MSSQFEKNQGYPVFVGYGMNIEELVALGKYDWVDPRIVSDHFPVTRKGETEVVIYLVHLNRRVTNDDALAELDNSGFRSADCHELLAFGAKYPEIQRNFPILELDFVWRYSSGHWVICLRGRITARDLHLYGIGYKGHDWLDIFRFAAVKKKMIASLPPSSFL